MNKTQKTLLKNEITLQLSKAKITTDNLSQVKKAEREAYIEVKLLEINDACLRWGLQKKVISEVELKTDRFFTDNEGMNDLAVSGGLLSGGAIGATVAYGATVSTVTSGGFLGFFATTSTVVTTTTLAATAAPLALAGAGVYGLIKYKEHKQNKELIAHFEKEKDKIRLFYINKVNKIQMIESQDGV